MGAARLHHRQVGTIRRVVRVSGRFVCGLCRSSYSDLPVARGCLEQCTDQVLEMDPVVIKRKQGKLAHRCRFCARDYDSKDSAYNCAEECKWKFRRKVLAEAHVTGKEESGETRLPPVKKVKQVVVPLVPIRKKAKSTSSLDPKPMLHPRIEDPVLVADSNEKPIDLSIAPNLTATDSSNDRVVKKRFKRKPSEMFFRDAAKYVCTVCQQKYFTKVEVTNCYESHE